MTSVRGMRPTGDAGRLGQVGGRLAVGTASSTYTVAVTRTLWADALFDVRFSPMVVANLAPLARPILVRAA